VLRGLHGSPPSCVRFPHPETCSEETPELFLDALQLRSECRSRFSFASKLCHNLQRSKVTAIAVYATLFAYCLLLEGPPHCDMFWFSFETSSGNIHGIFKKMITTHPLF
jgi:hypothetical protein